MVNASQNNEVTEYIQKLEQKNGRWQVEVCESLRTMVHKAIPKVEEKLQYGKPHFLKNGEFAAKYGFVKIESFFTVAVEG